ncbi:hypothetical protein KKA14_14465 [bacterium]|nr:hypothetical protein [bacterium]
MNIYFLIAAILILLIAVAHSVLGERMLIMPLHRMDLSEIKLPDAISKQILRFAWHLTTIVWWGAGFLVIYYARLGNTGNNGLPVKIISITFLLSSIFSFIWVRGKHFSWYVFLAIAALLWFGSP